MNIRTWTLTCCALVVGVSNVYGKKDNQFPYKGGIANVSIVNETSKKLSVKHKQTGYTTTLGAGETVMFNRDDTSFEERANMMCTQVFTHAATSIIVMDSKAGKEVARGGYGKEYNNGCGPRFDSVTFRIFEKDDGSIAVSANKESTWK